MCRFDKASKTWTHHSRSFSTAKRKYFILAYLEHWPTLNQPVQSNHSQMVDTCQRLQVKKSGIFHEGAAQSPFQGCCQRENFPLLTATRMFIWSDRSVWVNDSCCTSTNDTLPESQQGSYRTGQSGRQSGMSCSARLCQQQLKVGILNPNTSLSTNNRLQYTADLNQTLCWTARSR